MDYSGLQRLRKEILIQLCRKSRAAANEAIGCGIYFRRFMVLRAISESYYAIQSMAEAKDFLNDPYLGANLRTISEALLKLDTDDPYQVFGSPDHLKLLSCMTLFEAAEGEGGVFTQVIEKYYNGRRDVKTLDILEKEERE